MSNEKERDLISKEMDEDVEGFGYCSSSQSKCLTDCIGGTPALSNLN
ncbi:hypothetical protein INF30_11420 [Lachnospiraceae bacterium DSM 108991]|uniref:Uncharacterized protein n=1 Tax=Claveliimonas monacensis TaxID=2779351 RepID=A0ABR9RLK5_9FIRM|nr:hypothetical protein [Claveliimonas monacensis]MBE5063861.1 hypothetical protein [Claveliimonas monacensis]